jgi:pimeloyl-ACP methyl ester carboxylesterase
MYALELVVHTPQTITHPVPVLFLHGAWHAAWCWEVYFAPYFAAQGFVTYSMSLRGHGHSRGKSGVRWYSIDDYLDDLVDIIDHLPVKPVIVGHSLGGYLTQMYLETYKAPAAVLLAPAPSNGAWMLTKYGLRTDPLSLLQSGLTLSPYPLIGRLDRAQRAFFSPDFPQKQLEKYFSRLRHDSFRAYVELLLFRRLDSQAIREQDVPTLIVGGERDPLFPPAALQKLAAERQADLHIVPQTSHDIMLEARWQEAADHVINWLATKDI